MKLYPKQQDRVPEVLAGNHAFNTPATEHRICPAPGRLHYFTMMGGLSFCPRPCLLPVSGAATLVVLHAGCT